MSDSAPLVCGYAVQGGGGINNQKMAFLGVMLDGFESGLPVALPHITEMDQMAQRYDAYPFGEIFDEDSIRDLCRRWNIAIHTADGSTLYRDSYENYFWKTSNLFQGGMFDGINRERDSFVADTIRSLRPHLGRSRVVRAILSEIGAYPNLAVAQFRIERDWQGHAVHLARVHDLDEDIWLDHDRIARKIADTVTGIAYVYVVCDEAALLQPKEVIRKDCFAAAGIRLIFKSDILTAPELRAFGPLRLSLIDFEIARAADIFIGNSHSTFSNLVTLETYVAGGSALSRHYIYNKKGPLYRRQDLGLSTQP